ncbi:hypothetical protein PMAYCL1PPCAC_32245, partial [Pristionchus mayeri]
IFQMRSLLVALLLLATFSLIATDSAAPDCVVECVWRGTAPFCSGECVEGEMKLKEASSAEEAEPYEETFGSACWAGKKCYCCNCRKNDTEIDDSHLNRVPISDLFA